MLAKYLYGPTFQPHLKKWAYICLDFFHIAHTHPLGGVDVLFGSYDLFSNLHLHANIAFYFNIADT